MKNIELCSGHVFFRFTVCVKLGQNDKFTDLFNQKKTVTASFLGIFKMLTTEPEIIC